MNKDGKILILIGSDSDLPIIESCTKELDNFNIYYELKISSAHRTPDFTKKLIKEAEEKDFDCIIAAAGLAAHLPGVCAAYTILPVIGIPLAVAPLQGIDSLYSIVQMPPGVPVGTMGIGKSGAKNAAVFAAQILSLKHAGLKSKLKEYKTNMKEKVLSKNDSI